MRLQNTLVLLAALAAGRSGGQAAPDPAAWAGLAASYESGASAEPLRQLEAEVNASRGDAARAAALEAALVRLLAPGTTFEAKRFACLQLAVAGTEACVPALAALLGSDETAGIACFALNRLAAPAAGAALREALPASRGAARLQLVGALGRRGDADAVAPLVQLVRNPDPALARAAIRALGEIPAPAAGEALLGLAGGAAPELAADVAAASLEAAERLLAAGERREAAEAAAPALAAGMPDHLRRGAFGVLLRGDADGGEARILAALAATPPDPALAAVAVAAVGELRGEGVSQRFGERLPALAPELQVLLVQALGRRADGPAREALRACVRSEDPRVRRAAVQAVGALEDQSAVPLLAAALARAASADEAKSIQLALAGLRGGARTDEALCAALRGAAPTERPALMAALARRGSAAAVSALLEQACGAEEASARAARQALARLAEGGGSEALAALEQALGCGDARVREAALRALAAWRGPAAWEPLLAVLKEPKNAAERSLAWRGLVRVAGEGNARPDAALMARYKLLFAAAQSDAERKLALNTLAGAAHPDALALALPLIEVPGVRGEAAQAARRIAEAIKRDHPKAAEEALIKIKGGS